MIIIRLLFNGSSKTLVLSSTKINNYIPSVRKQTHCMDYNRTSPQLGSSGTVIVQPDLSQGFNYMNFGLVNSMCISFEEELYLGITFRDTAV